MIFNYKIEGLLPAASQHRQMLAATFLQQYGNNTQQLSAIQNPMLMSALQNIPQQNFELYSIAGNFSNPVYSHPMTSALLQSQLPYGVRKSDDDQNEKVTNNMMPSGAYLADKNIAVVPIFGTIKHYTDLFDYFFGGAVSSAMLSSLIYGLAASPNIKGIILHFYSPGGEVDGTKELINAILTAKKAKPVVALVEQAASCACWLQTACHYSIATSTMATTGSIGVFLVHIDRSGFYNQIGYAPTYIVSQRSPLKAIGNDSQPLSDSDRSILQSKVDATRNAIAADIRRFRNGISEDAFSGDDFPANVGRQLGIIDEIPPETTRPLDRAIRKTIELSKNFK